MGNQPISANAIRKAGGWSTIWIPPGGTQRAALQHTLALGSADVLMWSCSVVEEAAPDLADGMWALHGLSCQECLW